MRARGLALVVAVAANGVIGRDGGLPWHLPEDLKYFRRNTIGHAVVMGRRTWQSIGRPLPKRRNLVVSRDPGFVADGAEVFGSLGAALQAAWAEDEEPRVIGGASLYAEALPLATRILWTEVDGEPEGDVLFPDFDRGAWAEVDRQPGTGCSYVVLERRG